MKEKIIAALKLEYKDLGLSDETIAALAESMEPTVTAEDQIGAAVKGVAPLAKAVQSDRNRQINLAVDKVKKEAPAQQGGKAEGGDANDPKTPASGGDDTPPWAKTLIEQNTSLTKRMEAFEQGKSTDTRKARLEEKLTNVNPKFKERILKDFARLQFKDDGEFDTYLTEVETDAKDFVQEDANNALRGGHKPVVAGGKNDKAPPKELVDSVVSKIT